MKKIVINQNYFLTNDNQNWILNYEKEGDENPKTGKPVVSTDKWYCGTLEGCLNRYVSEASKPIDSISDLMVKLDEIKLSIQELNPKN